MNLRYLLLAITCAGLSTLAHALDRPAGPPPGDKPAHELPAEAYSSCQGRHEGDRVSAQGRDGHQLKGVCKKMQDGRLAMLPDGKLGHDGEPPRH